MQSDSLIVPPQVAQSAPGRGVIDHGLMPPTQAKHQRLKGPADAARLELTSIITPDTK